MDSKTVYYKPSPQRPALLLIVENGKTAVQVVKLNGDMRLGRNTPDTTCDIPLESTIVSRNHGDFRYIDGNYYYKDNNSLNGTYYNGKLLEKLNENGSRAVKLRDGDILRIDGDELGTPHKKAIEIIFSTTSSEHEQWKCYPLTDSTTVPIGRNIQQGISLTDFMVSRKHAYLEKVGNKWKIVDNDSMNGVAVNNQEIKSSTTLSPFDVIKIANSILIFTGKEIIYNQYIVDNNRRRNRQNTIMNVDIETVKVKSKTLLKDIKMDIYDGEFILILGGSGAGKTTFLNSILGKKKSSNEPSAESYDIQGKVFLKGMDLYKNFKILKCKIGIVEQFSTTRDNDTVIDTIRDTARIMLPSDCSKEEIEERVENAIEQMMLTTHKYDFIRSLSGGQKKRVEVAKQAVGNQEVFILDEPDSGMDRASRVSLMRNLKEFSSKVGVVMVISHSPDDAMDLFTKVIVLAKSQQDEVGHLAFYGDVQETLNFFGVTRLSEIVVEINYEGGKGRADEFIKKFERINRK